MTYLIVKMFFLLLLSALGGALLMYWWVRRRYQDVTISYTQSQSDNLALESELANLKRNLHSLEDVPAQLVAIAERVDSLPSQMESSLNDLRLPKPVEPEAVTLVAEDDNEALVRAVDIEPILEAIRNIQLPESTSTDLSPVLQAIEQLQIPAAKEPDLSPVMQAIDNIRIPEPKDVDLSSLNYAINSIPRPEQPDLTPLYGRISTIEAKLDRLLSPPETAVTLTAIESTTAAKQSSVNLLASPTHGEPDDLKRINGVGPSLEKMLHNIGVYYFWQIAEWSDQDVLDVDAMLDAFKGRIQRDNWVKQAKALAETDPA